MLKRYDLFRGLLWVTGLAIFDQLLFFVTYQLSVGGTVKASLGEGLIWQVLLYPAVAKAISFYLVAQVISYGLLLALVWFCCLQLQRVSAWFARRQYWLGTLLWTIAFLTLCLANIIYFPNSFYSIWLTKKPDYYTDIYPVVWNAWCGLGIALCGLLAACLAYFLYRHRHHRSFWKVSSLLALLVTAKLAYGWYQQLFPPVAPTFKQPNIIIIGLDALRPDHVGFNQGLHRDLTPNLDKFMQKAVIFNDTLTPLARTFPAWVSILTSVHPKHHGARFNLDAPEVLHVPNTLPQTLQAHGYLTWFATDESRFSNIEKEFGFDHMIRPPEGANDFLIGTLNDFPLTNLLVNSWIGEIFFPYSYANRAAFVTYRPATFVERLRKRLPNQAELKKPLFLSMHLLLSHWPNEWATSRFPEKALLTDRYAGSVQAIDEQWGEVMAMLAEKKLLDNAIVVVLSDHGEAVGLPGDRLLNEKKHMPGKDSVRDVERQAYATAPEGSVNFAHDFGIDTSYGHGTDILSMSQYQTVMAWQRFGDEAWAPKRINDRTSLLDIAPTLLKILNISSADMKVEGQSLAQNLDQGDVHKSARDFYIEDGYKIPALNAAKIDIHKVLEQSLYAYNINPQSGKVSMKPDLELKAIKGKSYAIISQRWVLAYYPPMVQRLHKKKGLLTINEPASRPARWYIVDLQTHQWSGDLNSVWARSTPAADMKKKLQRFYQGEIAG